ncbi:MAG: tyrosine--tRNA ligase [Bacilli bacterium]
MKLYDDLVWRGLIKDFSSPDLIEKLNNEKLTFYIGTDPTADSLHLGHLSSFLISKRLKDAGHNPILLIGGGTGLIGDPRPTTERDMQIKDEIFKNAESLKKQVEKLFGFKVVNNYDWIKEISAIDFLRDYGKYFNVNYMINKDIIRRRLDSGITYCELSYMILQSLDFLNLYKKEGCTLQVAGSDQWGNITSGIDLIRKKTGKEVYGFTMPLVVDKFGNKFGKSEGNALWLDKNKTSPYEIYQYLVNSDDEKVIEYLKIFTFLTHEEINSLEERTKKEPEKRLAQKTLAYEVVKFVHGEEEAEKAIKISESLFTGNIKELADNEIEIAFKGVPTFTTNKDTIINIMVNNNIASSKREAREFLSNNAISLDGETINDENFLIDNNKNYHIIKRGKKKYYLIKMN